MEEMIIGAALCRLNGDSLISVAVGGFPLCNLGSILSVRDENILASISLNWNCFEKSIRLEKHLATAVISLQPNVGLLTPPPDIADRLMAHV